MGYVEHVHGLKGLSVEEEVENGEWGEVLWMWERVELRVSL